MLHLQVQQQRFPVSSKSMLKYRLKRDMLIDVRGVEKTNFRVKLGLLRKCCDISCNLVWYKFNLL